MRTLALLPVLTMAASLLSQTPPKEPSILLNTGWRVQPAGRQVALGNFPMSTALSPDRKHLLVLNGGAGAASISVLDASTLQEVGRTPLPDGWLGLTFSPNGKFVYASGGSHACVYEFSFAADGKMALTRTFAIVPEASRKPSDFAGDVAISPDGRLIYVASLFQDVIHVINPQSGRVIEKFPTGRRPYRILFHPDGKTYFVSSWIDGSVYHHRADTGEKLDAVRIGQHPTDMVWRERKKEEQGEDQVQWAGRIFVAAANTNNVYVVGVSESKELRVIETINVAMTPRHPLGMTPSALALNADQSRLYVACSDANAVAVADVSEPRSRVLGFVPTGWYPTAVRSLAGGRLVMVNSREPGDRNTGTASIVDSFTDEQLQRYTKVVLLNSPYRDEFMDGVNTGPGNPVPSHPGDATPIEHVIYVMRATATTGPSSGPNQTKLAREFVQFDNFYVNGDGSYDGQSWSTGAIANDYVRKARPNGNGFKDPATRPPAGYLWTNAAAAGIPIRNYGWPIPAGDNTLAQATNTAYRGADPAYPDTERAKVFLKDLGEFEAQNKMPKLIFLLLDNSQAADSDQALGSIVEAVSKSKFWADTAIFVLDSYSKADDYRSPALVISPYTHRGSVDSNLYNTASMLRTMELILGLRPMTHFDAGARPMSAAFAKTPNTTQYTADR
ncbi:MAG: beta-propeller fold lactonase family protein [Bryobacteraceae bacterium]